MKVNQNREYSQSAVNWRAIKKLYAQGTKRAYSPKPNRIVTDDTTQNYNFREIERYFQSVISDITNEYNKRLSILQKDTKEMLEVMSKKIQALQQQIQQIKEQKGQQWDQVSPEQRDSILVKQFQQCQEESLVNIQESEQEQSLLDSLNNQKIYQNADKYVIRTKKKQYQMIKSSSNCRKLFQDTQMKTQPSEVIYPLSTKQSTVFDYCAKDIRQELNILRHCIEVTNNIKIQNYPISIGAINQIQLTTQLKIIQVNGSKNEFFHLNNQNNQLRDLIAKLKQQILNYSKQLQHIKTLLVKAISQQQGIKVYEQ